MYMFFTLFLLYLKIVNYTYFLQSLGISGSGDLRTPTLDQTMQLLNNANVRCIKKIFRLRNIE